MYSSESMKSKFTPKAQAKPGQARGLKPKPGPNITRTCKTKSFDPEIY